MLDKETEKILIYTQKAIAIAAVLFVVFSIIFVVCFLLPTGTFLFNNAQKEGIKTSAAIRLVNKQSIPVATANLWSAPSEDAIPSGKYGEMIRYGKELVMHTSRYFGPRGSIAKITNGMNCQNCHLQGGTKIFANNYSVFFSAYPKVSSRSGKKEAATQRIADCFQRSLNGKIPDPDGKEVQAMLAYMKWLNADVKKEDKIFGTATEKLRFLDRAADPVKGRLVYQSKCVSCHGSNGEGILAADKKEYIYPPLWGKQSYNDGAGLYRLRNFSGFVKNNMPFGASYKNAQLTDEEAWDVAAFVNTQPRPHKEQGNDYPNLRKKPIDAPYGPYGDKFSQQQHKLGPFKAIEAFYKN